MQFGKWNLWQDEEKRRKGRNQLLNGEKNREKEIMRYRIGKDLIDYRFDLLGIKFVRNLGIFFLFLIQKDKLVQIRHKTF